MLTFDIANFQKLVYQVFWDSFYSFYELISRETFVKTPKIVFSGKLLKLLLGAASNTGYFKRLFCQILQILCSICVEIIHLKSNPVNPMLFMKKLSTCIAALLIKTQAIMQFLPNVFFELELINTFNMLIFLNYKGTTSNILH